MNLKTKFAIRFVGRDYAECKAELDGWDVPGCAGFYPVVKSTGAGKGMIIAICDCTDDSDPYKNKPIVSDDYIDADAPDATNEDDEDDGPCPTNAPGAQGLHET